MTGYPDESHLIFVSVSSLEVHLCFSVAFCSSDSHCFIFFIGLLCIYGYFKVGFPFFFMLLVYHLTATVSVSMYRPVGYCCSCSWLQLRRVFLLVLGIRNLQNGVSWPVPGTGEKFMAKALAISLTSSAHPCWGKCPFWGENAHHRIIIADHIPLLQRRPVWKGCVRL